MFQCYRFIQILIPLALLGFVGCKSDSPLELIKTERPKVTKLERLPKTMDELGAVSLNNPNGILVLSEGNLTDGTGVLSFIDPTQALYKNDITREVNGRSLGSICQDLAVYKERLYILSQNGIYKGNGQMQHIAIFDKHFKYIRDFTPDEIVADGKLNPIRIGLAHRHLYFLAKGRLFQMDLDNLDKGAEEPFLSEIRGGLIQERLFSVFREKVEYLYFADGENIYRANSATDLEKCPMPPKHQILSVALEPKRLGDAEVRVWVLAKAEEAVSLYEVEGMRIKRRHILANSPEKLRKAQVRDSFPMEVLTVELGAMPIIRIGSEVYVYRSWRRTGLSRIYRSGRDGANLLYGYLGIDHRRSSIYFSELEDYPKYREAWVTELSPFGEQKQVFPVKGEGKEGLFVPFCAGIYPLASLNIY